MNYFFVADCSESMPHSFANLQPRRISGWISSSSHVRIPGGAMSILIRLRVTGWNPHFCAQKWQLWFYRVPYQDTVQNIYRKPLSYFFVKRNSFHCTLIGRRSSSPPWPPWLLPGRDQPFSNNWYLLKYLIGSLGWIDLPWAWGAWSWRGG